MSGAHLLLEFNAGECLKCCGIDISFAIVNINTHEKSLLSGQAVTAHFYFPLEVTARF